MPECAYCSKAATTKDALGLPACRHHAHAADAYFKQRTGRDPNKDTFLHCKKHFDLWQSGCQRCEACCQHHYDCTVHEKFGDAQTPAERGVRVVTIDPERTETWKRNDTP